MISKEEEFDFRAPVGPVSNSLDKQIENFKNEIAYYKQLTEAYKLIALGIQTKQLHKTAQGYSLVEALEKSDKKPVSLIPSEQEEKRRTRLLEALSELKEWIRNA